MPLLLAVTPAQVTKTSENMATLKIPYACKLLFQELQVRCLNREGGYAYMLVHRHAPVSSWDRKCHSRVGAGEVSSG